MLAKAQSSSAGVVVVTGATGWLGSAFLELVSSGAVDIDMQDLRLFASRERVVKGPDGSDLIVHDINTLIDLQENVVGFLHLAFLTKDKVNEMPLAEFIMSNMNLISLAAKFIQKTKPTWTVWISSGATVTSGARDLDAQGNPYGFLKNLEECLLADLCESIGSGYSVGRLWGATGLSMPPAHKYAISDFIQQGILQGKIEVRSPFPVFRRYVDAAEFLAVLIWAARDGANKVIDSGGTRIELGELANLISRQLAHVPVVRPSLNQDQEDDYTSDSHVFADSASRYGVAIADIESQVARTIAGHLKALHS